MYNYNTNSVQCRSSPKQGIKTNLRNRISTDAERLAARFADESTEQRAESDARHRPRGGGAAGGVLTHTLPFISGKHKKTKKTTRKKTKA